jgi:DNA polymerase IV
MMRNKIIFHIDIDSFFCSVEKIFDKTLQNVPFVVCGRNKRSVVGSASYEARALGVKAGMPFYKVELISNKIRIVNYNSDKYNRMSEMFFKIIKQKFSSSIEIASIDECYIDVTKQLINTKSTPIEYAKRIQEYMLNKINLPCSIGISNQKYLAKIATSIKKPYGVYEIYSDEVKNKL